MTLFHQSLAGLAYGFSVALEPHNLMWTIAGVLLGNVVGVLPGLGPLTAIALLLPLTFTMNPVPALMMLSGIFYGAIYGGAIGAILLNLPVHPAHAVTCLDGYPMTKQGKGGTALGITMISAIFASCFGIIVMILFSPLLVNIAFQFGPAEIFSIMLLGLLAGSTMSTGSPLKGVAMTLVGILCGVVGADVNTGTIRFTLGSAELQNGLNLVAVTMGLFGVAEFLKNFNATRFVGSSTKISFRDMWPNKKELKQGFFPMIRGTLVGALFGAMPGTGPSISTFVAYAFEKKISKTPERFGTGAIEGVASPEASTHSKTQIDFIPTLCLGIPGDVVMALILGALIIQGINPGPQLITEHPDLFWGLIASFWVGNVVLMLLNVPLIGIWVRLLQVPYRYLVPCALFFIAVGVFSEQNTLFEVVEALAFGIIGWGLLTLEFPLTPILLGFVLGPLVETNFRRALLLSRGSMATFIQRPISRGFIIVSVLLLLIQFVPQIKIWRGPRVDTVPGPVDLDD